MELKYDDHTHKSVIKWLVEINGNLELLNKEVDKFWTQQTAQRIIPKNLKTATSLRYYGKGYKELLDRDNSINLSMGYSLLFAENAEFIDHPHSIWFFECCVFPMGIKPATDIFQSWMIEIFQDMNTSQPNPFVGGIFHGEGTDFETHLVIHDKIF